MVVSSSWCETLFSLPTCARTLVFGDSANASKKNGAEEFAKPGRNEIDLPRPKRVGDRRNGRGSKSSRTDSRVPVGSREG